MHKWINSLPAPWNVLTWIGLVLAILALTWGLVRANRLVFRGIQKKQRSIHLTFLEKCVSLLILIGMIVLSVSAFGGFQSVWQTMLGGTALVSAVLAFVAQDVIKDVLAGLMISFSKPFEIGDRIVLEDGTAGVVKNITMRHTVIRGVESINYIIPNSKLNAQKLANFSYQRELQSVQFFFHIGYDSDMEQAKRVIARAIEDNQYSVPGLHRDGLARYSPVLFLAFEDSSLKLSTLVYFEKQNPTELVIDSVNCEVRDALVANGIEIPYSYVNVVTAPDARDEGGRP